MGAARCARPSRIAATRSTWAAGLPVKFSRAGRAAARRAAGGSWIAALKAAAGAGTALAWSAAKTAAFIAWLGAATEAAGGRLEAA